MGENVEIKVLTRSDLFAANLFAAKLSYPANLLELVSYQNFNSADLTNSYLPVNNWVEQFFDNETGQASFVAGIPSPGYITQAGAASPILVSLTFKAKVGRAVCTW